MKKVLSAITAFFYIWTFALTAPSASAGTGGAIQNIAAFNDMRADPRFKYWERILQIALASSKTYESEDAKRKAISIQVFRLLWADAAGHTWKPYVVNRIIDNYWDNKQLSALQSYVAEYDSALEFLAAQPKYQQVASWSDDVIGDFRADVEARRLSKFSSFQNYLDNLPTNNALKKDLTSLDDHFKVARGTTKAVAASILFDSVALGFSIESLVKNIQNNPHDALSISKDVIAISGSLVGIGTAIGAAATGSTTVSAIGSFVGFGVGFVVAMLNLAIAIVALEAAKQQNADNYEQTIANYQSMLSSIAAYYSDNPNYDYAWVNPFQLYDVNGIGQKINGSWQAFPSSYRVLLDLESNVSQITTTYLNDGGHPLGKARSRLNADERALIDSNGVFENSNSVMAFTQPVSGYNAHQIGRPFYKGSDSSIRVYTMQQADYITILGDDSLTVRPFTLQTGEGEDNVVIDGIAFATNDNYIVETGEYADTVSIKGTLINNTGSLVTLSVNMGGQTYGTADLLDLTGLQNKITDITYDSSIGYYIIALEGNVRILFKNEEQLMLPENQSVIVDLGSDIANHQLVGSLGDNRHIYKVTKNSFSTYNDSQYVIGNLNTNRLIIDASDFNLDEWSYQPPAKGELQATLTFHARNYLYEEYKDINVKHFPAENIELRLNGRTLHYRNSLGPVIHGQPTQQEYLGWVPQPTAFRFIDGRLPWQNIQTDFDYSSINEDTAILLQDAVFSGGWASGFIDDAPENHANNPLLTVSVNPDKTTFLLLTDKQISEHAFKLKKTASNEFIIWSPGSKHRPAKMRNIDIVATQELANNVFLENLNVGDTFTFKKDPRFKLHYTNLLKDSPIAFQSRTGSGSTHSYDESGDLKFEVRQSHSSWGESFYLTSEAVDLEAIVDAISPYYDSVTYIDFLSNSGVRFRADRQVLQNDSGYSQSDFELWLEFSDDPQFRIINRMNYPVSTSDDNDILLYPNWSNIHQQVGGRYMRMKLHMNTAPGMTSIVRNPKLELFHSAPPPDVFPRGDVPETSILPLTFKDMTVDIYNNYIDGLYNDASKMETWANSHSASNTSSTKSVMGLLAGNQMRHFHGRMYFDANVNYQFKEVVDNEAFLRIDNAIVLEDSTWNSHTTGSYSPILSGYKDVDFYVRNGGGSSNFELQAKTSSDTYYQIVVNGNDNTNGNSPLALRDVTVSTYGGSSGSASELKSWVESHTNWYSDRTSASSLSGSLNENELKHFHGRMYLLAGQTYQFKEFVDDHAYLLIDRTTILNNNGWNDHSVGTFTPSDTGYYSVDFYVRNGDGPGNYQLQAKKTSDNHYQDIAIAN